MKRERTKNVDLGSQAKRHATTKPTRRKEYEGDTENVLSTGSTLLDLAISGGRVRGGGIPAGIMVVAYGPSGTGKTVLACELAGEVQRKGGVVDYKDAEGRLNKPFAEVFDLDVEQMVYSKPDIIPEAFKTLMETKHEKDQLYGYFVDSLAALSTSLEMENEEGDKMGGRRAKEFSMYLRKSKQIISHGNIILFCTNQIRENMDGGAWARKDVNPGGKAIEFYSSLILRFTRFKKIKESVLVKGKKVERVVGIEGEIEVDKSSIWKPHRTAEIVIYYDYGIDDIRANLQFVKNYTGSKVYSVNDNVLNNSMEKSIQVVEEESLEEELKNQVIDLWEEIESKFEHERKKKKR
jgi:protein RecA